MFQDRIADYGADSIVAPGARFVENARSARMRPRPCPTPPGGMPGSGGTSDSVEGDHLARLFYVGARPPTGARTRLVMGRLGELGGSHHLEDGAVVIPPSSPDGDRSRCRGAKRLTRKPCIHRR